MLKISWSAGSKTSKMGQIFHWLMHECRTWAKCLWEFDTCGHFVFLVIRMARNIWPTGCRTVHSLYFGIQAEFFVRVEWRFPKLPSVRGEVQVALMKDNIARLDTFPFSVPKLVTLFLIHGHLRNILHICKSTKVTSMYQEASEAFLPKWTSVQCQRA